MKFSEKLLKLRKSNGLSQEDLAIQLGVSRQTISKWELDESMPEIDKIIQISKLFSISTDYLLKEDLELEHKDSNRWGEVLYISSTALIIIGYILAIMNWYEYQRMDVLVPGFIIQIVGVVVYFSASVISKTKANRIIKLLNLAVLIFIPISMLVTSILSGRAWPYPNFPSGKLLFLFLYTGVLLVANFLFKNYKK